MTFNTWSDYYASEDQFENNVAALEIIQLLDVPSPDEAVRNLQTQDSLSALLVDDTSGDLLLVHHVTKIGKSLKKKGAKKKEKLVGLNGTGTTACPIRFEHPDEAFGPKCIVSADMPNTDSLETFKTAQISKI